MDWELYEPDPREPYLPETDEDYPCRVCKRDMMECICDADAEWIPKGETE